MRNMRELYETNADFKRYVGRYCFKHGKTVDEAVKDYIVIEYGKVCMEKEANSKDEPVE